MFLTFQNDTMQVVWQYHAKEPASVAGVLPGHGAVRGSRPLYLVQRDTQPKRSSHNQESEPVLKTWDVLNQQVSFIHLYKRLVDETSKVMHLSIDAIPTVTQFHSII